MREIKFRAWDNNVKEMIIQDNTDRIDKIPHYWETHIKTTIMQYTGLKDKNGKDVYEGDIIIMEGNISSCKGVVEFINQGSNNILGYAIKINKNEIRYIFADDKLEVIGNIYENKELLEESK